MPESRAEQAPENAAPAAPVPAKKSKKMLFIIIIGAVIAALGIGGGVYAFVSKKSDDTEQTLTNAKGKKIKTAVVKKDTKPKDPAIYTAFDPPFVVNFEDKGAMRFLQVSVQIMTRDPHTAEMFKQHDPVIRNDLLLLLGNQTFDTLNSREGKEKLREEARQAVANIIKSEGGSPQNVEQLYFTSFVMQ